MSAVFPLVAPPPARTNAPVPAVDVQSVVLADVLHRLQKTQPGLFASLVVALHQKLDPELQHIKRVPRDLLPTAQGRVQVADEILVVVDNCAAIVASAQAKSSQSAPPRGIP